MFTGNICQRTHSEHTAVPKTSTSHVFKTSKTLTQKTSLTLSWGRLRTSPQHVYILGLMDVFWVNVWTSWKRCLEDVLGIRCVPAVLWPWPGSMILHNKGQQLTSLPKISTYIVTRMQELVRKLILLFKFEKSTVFHNLPKHKNGVIKSLIAIIIMLSGE